MGKVLTFIGGVLLACMCKDGLMPHIMLISGIVLLSIGIGYRD